VIREVVEKSVGLLESKCIRLNGHETDWRALFSEQLTEITAVESAAKFEQRVNEVMTRAGLSRVAFFHESAQRAPARYAINATFSTFQTPEGSRWIFQDVHEGGPDVVRLCSCLQAAVTSGRSELRGPRNPCRMRKRKRPCQSVTLRP